MNICGYNKNARVARRKFWVMGGTKVHMGGDTEFLGWGGTAFHGGGQGLDGGGVQGHPGALWEPLLTYSNEEVS